MRTAFFDYEERKRFSIGFCVQVCDTARGLISKRKVAREKRRIFGALETHERLLFRMQREFREQQEADVTHMDGFLRKYSFCSSTCFLRA